MLCLISDLFVDVPETGNLTPRLRDYRHEEDRIPDIRIDEASYRLHLWETLSEDGKVYMESGFCFYRNLLHHNGMMLHASAVAYEGRAYLFSGPSGMGKSTHTRLWQQVFGAEAKVFNDDKPALRRLEDRWYAYGTPWCGKDGINLNMKVPLAGICFLRRGTENRIRRLSDIQAIRFVMSQTLHKLGSENMTLLIAHIDKLIREVPIFEFENIPVPDAARISYETMRRAAEEEGL